LQVQIVLEKNLQTERFDNRFTAVDNSQKGYHEQAERKTNILTIKRFDPVSVRRISLRRKNSKSTAIYICLGLWIIFWADYWRKRLAVNMFLWFIITVVCVIIACEW